MTRPKVKICGITNIIDAKNALNLGADFIGFINVKSSPRFLTITELEDIVKDLSDEERKKSILLTKDDSVDGIINASSRLGIKIIQPYSSLSPNDLSKLRLLGYKIFQPIRVEDEDDLEAIEEFKDSCDLIILDSKGPDPSVLGGTGEVFDWKLFENASKKYDKDLVLSGGVSPENIQEAIEQYQPYMVDICSSLESKPGIKSLERMKELFNNINTANIPC